MAISEGEVTALTMSVGWEVPPLLIRMLWIVSSIRIERIKSSGIYALFVLVNEYESLTRGRRG
jgi:hypothetical protein